MGKGGDPVRVAHYWADARPKLNEVFDRDGADIAAEGLRRIAEFDVIAAYIRSISPGQRQSARQTNCADGRVDINSNRVENLIRSMTSIQERTLHRLRRRRRHMGPHRTADRNVQNQRYRAFRLPQCNADFDRQRPYTKLHLRPADVELQTVTISRRWSAASVCGNFRLNPVLRLVREFNGLAPGRPEVYPPPYPAKYPDTLSKCRDFLCPSGSD
ncbi:MAG: hypothetical protein L0H65_17385 [Pseudorhodobacter sp.]|nr:hypothetical protein [Pseudorhodobacter sp.]MDN5788788.1 hypothetical protein [Pseudorhodobacter sp.]